MKVASPRVRSAQLVAQALTFINAVQLESVVARVRSLVKGGQTIKVHPSEVDCFYQLVEGKDGKKYLHLSTFGSDGRLSEPKSSQSIQIDEDIARKLVQIIGEAFGQQRDLPAPLGHS